MVGRMLGGQTAGFKVPQLQADATLSQANPVSGTAYTVLATSANVIIKTGWAKVTWTVQPTTLEVRYVIDGITVNFGVGNPVSADNYEPQINKAVAMASSGLVALNNDRVLYEIGGRSVTVAAEVTGGTSNPLEARIKYVQW